MKGDTDMKGMEGCVQGGVIFQGVLVWTMAQGREGMT